jgi:hypothetical protein
VFSSATLDAAGSDAGAAAGVDGAAAAGNVVLNSRFFQDTSGNILNEICELQQRHTDKLLS